MNAAIAQFASSGYYSFDPISFVYNLADPLDAAIYPSSNLVQDNFMLITSSTGWDQFFGYNPSPLDFAPGGTAWNPVVYSSPTHSPAIYFQTYDMLNFIDAGVLISTHIISIGYPAPDEVDINSNNNIEMNATETDINSPSGSATLSLNSSSPDSPYQLKLNAGNDVGEIANDGGNIIQFGANPLAHPSIDIESNGVSIDTNAIVMGRLLVGFALHTNTCGSATTCNVSCPGGTVLTGGGCNAGAALSQNSPDATNSTTQWDCATRPPTSIIVYAFCGRLGN